MIKSFKSLPKEQRKLLNAWCSYDWANSVYNLIVTTAIFPVYYLGVTKLAFSGDVVSFFGFSFKNEVLYSYAISFSFLVIMLLSPILSGIADYGGKKKKFMQFFTYLGASACIGLYFFTGENIVYGVSCAVLASLGYAGSLVFYNAFLADISPKDLVDDVSAKGFSLGYIGSVILLIVSLLIITFFDSFGFSDKLAATRFIFPLVGIWWIGFAQIAFNKLKDKSADQSKEKVNYLKNGLLELSKVLKKIISFPSLKKFLAAFLFYNLGVQTVMLLAPLFGEKEIGMEGTEMILVVLILQLVAIAGASLMAKLSDRKGNKFAILGALLIWLFICIASFFLSSKIQFYALAALLGFVMGGIQSLSRSTYAKLLPDNEHDTASFFSFYDITEKLSIVAGTFLYGFIAEITGSMRNSTLFMALFFIAGILILLTAKLPLKKYNR